VSKYITNCRICFARVAESPALELPIFGYPGKKIETLVKVLLKHLEKHHPSEFQQGNVIYQEFLQWIVLDAFAHADPSIGPRLENFRAALFQQVRKNTFTDEPLAAMAASLALNSSDESKVLGALKLVRDACCETGTYAPAIQNTPLVI
jgi:hypothetical protein